MRVPSPLGGEGEDEGEASPGVFSDCQRASMVRGIRLSHPEVLFSGGLGGMGEEVLKPLQDSSKSLFRLFFNPDSASQVNQLFEESFALVEKGCSKAVGPEGEFKEEVDPS